MRFRFFVKRLPVKPRDTVKILDKCCDRCGGELRIRTTYKLSANQEFWYSVRRKYCKYCGLEIGAGK